MSELLECQARPRIRPGMHSSQRRQRRARLYSSAALLDRLEREFLSVMVFTNQYRTHVDSYYRFVIEYAHHFYPHLKIIASAGSPEKLEVLKESGADVVFNYKTANLDEVLKEHGPIDMYACSLAAHCTLSESCSDSFWDHVAGETLDTTLGYMNMFGLILVCGPIVAACSHFTH